MTAPILLFVFETLLATLLYRRWGGVPRTMAWTVIPVLALPLAASLTPLPSRYATFAIGFTVILLQVWIFARKLDGDSEPRAGRVGVLLAMILAALAVQQVYSPPFDDESMRLMATLSFGTDGDFDLRDEYRAESWHAFRERGPAYFIDFADKVRHAIKSDHRPFFPYHSAGFAVVIWPGFAVGSLIDPRVARLGAGVPILASAVALAVLLVRVLCDTGYAPRMARRLVAVFALSAPPLFHGVHLWPEPLAALAGTWIVSVVMRKDGTRLSAMAVGAVLAFLPHMHFRYAFLSMTLAVVVLIWMRPFRWGWVIAGGILPGFVLIANMAIRNHPYTWSILWKIGYAFPAAMGLPDFAASRLMDLPLVMNRVFAAPAGLLLYMPVLFVFSSRGNSLRRPLLLAASGTIVATLGYAVASGPVARFWVPILPLLFLASLPRERVSRLWTGLATLGVAKGILLCSVPVLCHDALFAKSLAERFSFPLNALMVVLFG
jgi:hypothetical protein